MALGSVIFLGVESAAFESVIGAANALTTAEVLGAEALPLVEAYSQVTPEAGSELQSLLNGYQTALRQGDTTHAKRAKLEMATVVRQTPQSTWSDILDKVRKTGWAMEGGLVATIQKPITSIKFSEIPSDVRQIHEFFLKGIVINLNLGLAEPYELTINTTEPFNPEDAKKLTQTFFAIDPRLVQVTFADTRFSRPPLPPHVQRKQLWRKTESTLPTAHNEWLLESLKGAVLAAIAADALGVPVEFTPRKAREEDPVTSMRGHGTYNQLAGTWSDDSSMMLGLLTSLAAAGFDPSYQGLAYLRWRYAADLTARGEVFDVGVTTHNALANILQGTPAENAGGIDEQDNGNGSLMRTLPLAFYGIFGTKDITSLESLHILFNQSLAASAVTHRHPRSQLACAIYTILARHLLAGETLEEGLAKTQKIIQQFAGERPDIAAELPSFERIFQPNFKNLPKGSVESGGYVLHTLEAAIWSLFHSSSYAEAVLTAVNLGGDTDTTGVVTGGLAGIIYGFKDIPEDWLKILARTEDIVKMVEDFVAAEKVRVEERLHFNPYFEEILSSFFQHLLRNNPMGALNALAKPFRGPRSKQLSPRERQRLLSKLRETIQKNFNSLVDQLNAKDFGKRGEAAFYLAVLGTEEAVEKISQSGLGIKDPTWMVRAAVGEGLAVNGSDAALNLLQQMVADEPTPKVINRIVIALSQSDSPRGKRMLQNIFPESSLRTTALEHVEADGRTPIEN